MNGLLTWIVVYSAMVFAVLIPAFGQPEGFLEWLAVVVVSWVVANIAQAIVE